VVDAQYSGLAESCWTSNGSSDAPRARPADPPWLICKPSSFAPVRHSCWLLSLDKLSTRRALRLARARGEGTRGRGTDVLFEPKIDVVVQSRWPTNVGVSDGGDNRGDGEIGRSDSRKTSETNSSVYPPSFHSVPPRPGSSARRGVLLYSRVADFELVNADSATRGKPCSPTPPPPATRRPGNAAAEGPFGHRVAAPQRCTFTGLVRDRRNELLSYSETVSGTCKRSAFAFTPSEGCIGRSPMKV